MDYDFDRLDPERFQQFCQALVQREFPNLRCFPVGQPDGGRDALSEISGTREFVVFQVKFVRQPSEVESPYEWLASTLQAEASKVQNLATRGAKAYRLLTNLRGTSHLEVGSIDKIESLLTSLINIPSMCLWRDDLNRRLDNAPELRWSYPELLTNTDILRLIIESGLSEHRERREAAVRAFLRQQYEEDKTVRFKQIELQNGLIDLFVDLFVHPYHPAHRFLQAQLLNYVDIDSEPYYETDYPESTSKKHHAATVLLCESKPHSRTVLEGAPGQGKSTIAQYVAQVHRLRLLNDPLLLSLPDDHRHAPLRLPIKADLRAFAIWLRKEDPFCPSSPSREPVNWNKSLESFLAALITNSSGGISFDNSDILAILKHTPVLIILDGLDEVADIDTRKIVVEEIVNATNRLSANAPALQVLVTSRPSAFANSPGLPEETFTYQVISSLTRSQIDEYANKWMRANSIRKAECDDIRSILTDKLNQPHLRDLARNPMQLAILLSLVHTQGSSLPDERTALYDAYVRLFFNRESDKNDLVRDHRRLLVDIHEFIAYLLHSEAEQGRQRGTITAERLRREIRDYIEEHGGDPSLTEKLFHGAVERVLFLVSRLQGTFEFDVQPLREYFAARYLYETSPYSPAGNERRGTKPDRFDALARDFYWLNVTRFFAGCFSKGELAGLAERVEELAFEPTFQAIFHPRILASMLLADWVFAQEPKSMRRVAEVLLDDIGLQYLIGSSHRETSRVRTQSLSRECGGDELLHRCLDRLAGWPPFDKAMGLAQLARRTISDDRKLKALWLAAIKKETRNSRTQWLEYGLHLGTLDMATEDEIEQIVGDEPQVSLQFDLLLRSNKARLCEITAERVGAVLGRILDGGSRYFFSQRQPSILGLFAAVLDPRLYTYAIRLSPPLGTPSEYWRKHNISLELPPFDGAGESASPLARSRKFVEQVSKLLDRPCVEWATQIAPWNEVVEGLRHDFGDSWSIYRLATFASGIRSSIERFQDADELFDGGYELCKCARCARMRSGVPQWWRHQLRTAKNDLDVSFGVLMALLWCTRRTLVSLVDDLEELVKRIPLGLWTAVAENLEEALQSLPAAERLPFEVSDLPDNVSASLAALFALRGIRKSALKIFDVFLKGQESTDPVSCGLNYRLSLAAMRSDKRAQATWLEGLKNSYAGASKSEYGYYTDAYFQSVPARSLTIYTARAIMASASDLPTQLVLSAEAKCREAVARKVAPVGTVARAEQWFGEKDR